jgi:hypothetical protein
MCLNCDNCVTLSCLNTSMENIFNMLILLMIPWAFVGIYILLNDLSIHKLMKSGRINKVANKVLR